MMKAVILSAVVLSLPAFAQDNQGQRGAPLRASLIGYQEVPSVSSKADAEFEARVAADGQSFDYTLVYDGLQADVLMSHIHFAQKSVNGPIIVWLCGTAAQPGPAGTQTCPGRSGTIHGTVTSASVAASPTTQQLAAGDLAALIDAMRAGAAYVNIHSTVSPGGEIRGQIGARGNSDGDRQ
jgi:hypothetical protein